MSIDYSPNMKPGRFNTKEILLHFINLMNKDLAQLDAHTRASLATLGSAIAQVSKDLQNPLPKIIETLKAHMGTPGKGSKGAEILLQVTTFENNFLPTLTIQQEDLKKTQALLRSQYDLIIAKGAGLEMTRIETFKAELEKVMAGKLKAYKDQKENALDSLKPIQEAVEKTSGKGKVNLATEQEEVSAPSQLPPSPS